MTVLVDLTSLADNFSGIERFALSITKELLNAEDRNDLEYILLFKNEVHKEFLKVKKQVKKMVLYGNNKLLFNQFILPKALFKIKADYYFFPAFPAPFFFFNKKAITAIHDVGCWDSPSKNKKYMIAYFKIMYSKASFGKKKIITVSEFSKKRIIDILKKDSKDIEVIYDGLSDCFENFSYKKEKDIMAKTQYKLPNEYMLCLSTLEPRKNLRLLVKAYDELLKEKKIDMDLVLAGRKGWAMDDLLNNLNKKSIERIHFTGFIEDNLLPYIYKNANLFVFPSKYEGFGVPPIEAMSMGVPVVSSDAASLPEVLEDAAYYFTNDNLKSLKERIVYVLSLKEDELNISSQKGIRQAHKFNWKTEALKLRDKLFV